MNFLAHAYLSFNDPPILAGNMFSDFVKGKKKFDYPLSIQKGIQLHRKIDEFTDDHLTTRELKLIFKPSYGLYASPLMDVMYDHFLATDQAIFPTADILYDFSQEVYLGLEQNEPLFPEKFARMYPYMKSQNWLFHYRSLEGLRSSLGGLMRRAKYITEVNTAYALFIDNYQTLKAGFGEFFPQLLEMSKQTYDDLI